MKKLFTHNYFLKFGIYCSAILFFSLPVSSFALSADNPLSKINLKIQSTQQDIIQEKNQTDNIQSQLKEAEINIGKINGEISDVNRQLTSAKKLLFLLTAKQTLLTSNLQNQNQQLATQLKTMYILENDYYLHALLNQDNFNDLTRNINYLKYFNQKRQQEIASIEHTLQAINANKAQIKKQTDELEALKKNKQAKQLELMDLQHSRKQILTDLNHTIKNKQQELIELSQNKNQLQKLVTQLANTTPTAIQPPLSFDKMQGRLNWPTKGNIAEAFGQAIHGSELTNNGVLISAAEGQNVYAIYPGKVIFANWLKGYGLIMIIDHGNGYLSLYGRDSMLYKKVGETVNAGDMIATVGNTGGFEQSGLYFEIRHNGEPINPSNWCA